MGPPMPPPGMAAGDPMGMAGGDPMAAGGMPGMEPPKPPEPVDPYRMVLDLLKAVAESHGKDVASALLASLPAEVIGDLLQISDSNPEDAALLEALLPQEQGPVYPKWFVTPRKPKPAEIEEIAESDHIEWQVVRDRIKRDLEFLHQERTAVRDDFDEDYDHEFLDTGMSDEVRAIAAMIGSIEPSYEVPWYKPDVEDATQQVEDALYCWDAEAQAQYQAAGNGPYAHEVAMYLLTTGYVMSRVAFDINNPQNPFMEVLLSPATCVPTFDDRGLLRVTRKYVDTVANVIADFDMDGKLRNKILKTKKKSENKDDSEVYRLTDHVQVTTYHDRWWYSITADDIEVVKPTAHKLGFVPYIVQGTGSGEPNAITELTTRGDVARGRGLTNSRSRLEYKHQSHFGFRYKSHAQKEEILSVIRTLFQNANNPAWVLEQDELAEVAGDPEIDNRPGKVTKLKAAHEALRELLTDPQAVAMFQPLMGAIAMGEATNRLSPAFYGVNEAANTSGNAAEGLIESGKDKLTIYLMALESYYAERAMMRMRWFRDWGQQIENDRGEYGVLDIPYQRHRAKLKGLQPTFHLTTDTVSRTGVKVKCRMTHVRMQNLAALGNAAAMWMNINAMSAREAMELRGHRDPDSVFEERRYEKAMLDENVDKALTYLELKERDPEAAALYYQLVTTESFSTGGGAAGAGSDPTGQTFRGPNTSAMNLQPLGMGQQGATGRPTGSAAPGMTPFPGGAPSPDGVMSGP